MNDPSVEERKTAKHKEVLEGTKAGTVCPTPAQRKALSFSLSSHNFDLCHLVKISVGQLTHFCSGARSPPVAADTSADLPAQGGVGVTRICSGTQKDCADSTGTQIWLRL
ncbi:hypothetical protein TcWFU_002129 [Taenia crassiceps]|uniref:Uncharacterized protein n=1 Tax=Taenia crassiceps TaxID=6207 RepID=A0ABR4Q4K9_9CEST